MSSKKRATLTPSKWKFYNVRPNYTIDDLNAIKGKMDNFSEDEAFDLYALNYSTLALIKSCEILGINKEMIFRGVDY